MKRAVPALLILAFAAAASAAPPAGFNARVDKLRQEIGVPGMAIAIVEDGKVTLAKGFGVRALGGNRRVKGEAIFPHPLDGQGFHRGGARYSRR
jgi:CubicO group peptidase (beta-lactamase class C family)